MKQHSFFFFSFFFTLTRSFWCWGKQAQNILSFANCKQPLIKLLSYYTFSVTTRNLVQIISSIFLCWKRDIEHVTVPRIWKLPLCRFLIWLHFNVRFEVTIPHSPMTLVLALMHAGATLVLTLVFQQVLNCWYRVFPHSEAEKSSDGCSHLGRTFSKQASTERMWVGIKKRQIWENASFGSIVSQSLRFLVQDSSFTPTMDDEVWHQGADALHWPLLPSPSRSTHAWEMCQDVTAVSQCWEAKVSMHRGQEDGESNGYLHKGDILQVYNKHHVHRS